MTSSILSFARQQNGVRFLAKTQPDASEALPAPGGGHFSPASLLSSSISFRFHVGPSQVTSILWLWFVMVLVLASADGSSSNVLYKIKSIENQLSVLMLALRVLWPCSKWIFFLQVVSPAQLSVLSTGILQHFSFHLLIISAEFTMAKE